MSISESNQEKDRERPSPLAEEPNELTGVAPKGDGKVSNRPTNVPTQVPPPD